MQQANGYKYRDLLIAIVLLLAGFLVRWFYILTLEISSPIRGDAISYYYYAKNMLEYGVFSLDRAPPPVADSYWAPGYPFFLAFCFKLADLFKMSFYPVVLFLQSCMGGGIVFFTYLLGRSFLSAKAAIAASILVILCPHLNTHGGYILSETLFCFWLITSLYFFQRAAGTLAPVYWVAAGVSFGMSYLANPVILFLPLILGAYYVIDHRVRAARTPVKNIGLFLTVFLVFVVGWGLRSLVSVPAERASSSQRAFENLVIGAHKDYHDIWYANITAPDPSLKVVNQADVDMQRYKNDHAAFYRELASRIFNEPADYLHWYFIQKPLDLWGWKILVGDGDVYVFPVDSSMYQSSKVALVSLVIMKQLHIWLFALAVVGVFFARREIGSRKESGAPLFATYALLIYTSSVFVVLHADARYSVPMRPEMYLCAVYAIQRLYSVLKALNEKSKLPAVSS